MWILKNSKELDHLTSKAISEIYSIKTFDFPRFAEMPHEQFKYRLSGLYEHCSRTYVIIYQICEDR